MNEILLQEIPKHVFNALEKVLTYKVDLVTSLCDEVYIGYQTLLNMLATFSKHKPQLDELSRRWKPSHYDLIRLREVNQRDPNAPGEIKEIEEMVDIIIKEIYYIEHEEGRIKEKLSSFHTIKHWTILEFIDKEGRVKSLEE